MKNPADLVTLKIGFGYLFRVAENIHAKTKTKYEMRNGSPYRINKSNWSKWAYGRKSIQRVVVHWNGNNSFAFFFKLILFVVLEITRSLFYFNSDCCRPLNKTHTNIKRKWHNVIEKGHYLHFNYAINVNGLDCQCVRSFIKLESTCNVWFISHFVFVRVNV